jgi:hypothetical protein
MLSNFDQGVHPETQHTGFYNDPDMMVLGMPGLTDAENRVHMSLWAISGAPLLVGADLSKLSDATLATLTNPAVLAIDQDPLGLQAVKVHEEPGGLEVWSKRLARPGERAVLVLNRSEAAASIVVSPITVSWKDLGLASSTASVRDVWTEKDLGSFEDGYTAVVQRGDAVLLMVRGTEAKFTRILPVATAGSGPKNNPEAPSEQTFSIKPSSCGQAFAAIRIVYKNTNPAPSAAELRVNGQDTTRIEFPPTGADEGAIWIEARLDRNGPKSIENNTMNFSTSAGPLPQIESIYLQQSEDCEGIEHQSR